MTLILRARAPGFVIQASDRMVSLRRGTALEQYDAASNKSLIYYAEDGILTLAYTGLAYIARKTTDQWIAETMCGVPFPEGCTQSYRYVREWRLINAALRNVGEALDRAYENSNEVPSRSRDISMIITGVGWHVNRRRTKAWNIAFDLVKSGSGSRSVLSYWHRHGAGFAAEGSGYKLITDAMLEPYYAAPDPLAKARALAGVIKEVSQWDASVGPDALAVILMPPGCEGSGIAYYTRHYEASEGPLGLEPPVFYSPWVLTQEFVSAPSRVWGSTIDLAGSWRLAMPLNPTDYGGRFIALMFAQPRRSPP